MHNRVSSSDSWEIFKRLGFIESCQVNSLTQLTSSVLDTIMIVGGLEVLESLKLSFHLFGAIGSSKTVFEEMFLLDVA